MRKYSYSYEGLDRGNEVTKLKASFDIDKDTVLLEVGYHEVILPLEVIDDLHSMKGFIYVQTAKS